MADEEENKEEDAADESAENAEGSEEGAEGEDGEGGGDSKKKLLLIVAPVVLLLLIGGGLFFTGMLDSLLGGGAKEEQVEGEHGEHADGDHGDGHKEASGDKDDHGDGHGGGGAFLEIPTMIVNLNTDNGTPRYLRLSVQLELADPSEAPEIEEAMPRVIDQFQTYLRELRVKDLRGSAGIYRLQMELLWRVNQAAAPVKVKDVLFQEILIQ